MTSTVWSGEVETSPAPAAAVLAPSARAQRRTSLPLRDSPPRGVAVPRSISSFSKRDAQMLAGVGLSSICMAALIFGLAESEKSCVVKAEAAIYANEVFERLKGVGKSLGEVTADATDYRARLREALDDQEKELCVRMVALKRLAITANRNLDVVYKAIAR